MTRELFILPEDLEYAVKRGHELALEIKNLGLEFGDAFTQSSETWHDNAPFEAVRDKQSVLAAELAHIRQVIRTSAVALPKTKRGRAGYGSLVTLSNGKTYKIAGDWTPHAGRSAGGIITVSAKSPIGAELIGKKLQDTVAVGSKTEQIIAITS